MAYFMSKNRLVAKAVNFRPLPYKWTPKWAIVRRSTSTTRQQLPNTPTVATAVTNTTTTTTNTTTAATTTIGQTGGRGSDGRGNSSKGKGKFDIIKRKWSWKAGASWTVLSVLDWWLLAAGGWLTWQGVFFRWTPIGLCFVAAMQWRHQNKELDEKGLPRIASQWQMNVYCSLPLRLVSRCWGWLADCRVPTPLRPAIYGLYSSTFGVNLEEAASADFKNYRSLAEFFARSLKDNVRLIDPLSCLVSPCDGKVLHFGPVKNSQIEQVKGVSYNIESFLGPSTWSKVTNPNYVDCIKHKSENELYQCIIYLAPGDYHRFHSPVSWIPDIRRHFSGELLSVSPKIAQWVPGLFCLNERALYIGNWRHGFFSFTAVGATNVGSVKIYMDEHLKTNRWMGWKIGTYKGNDYEELKLEENTNITKGEILGQFNMGSTIVLIFEAPSDFQFNIHSGQKILMGEKLGCI